MNKELQTNFEMLKDENISNEIKVLLLLEMVHQEVIGITKAKEICTEIGIFSDHWMVIDAQATEIFSEIHSLK